MAIGLALDGVKVLDASNCAGGSWQLCYLFQPERQSEGSGGETGLLSNLPGHQGRLAHAALK